MCQARPQDDGARPRRHHLRGRAHCRGAAFLRRAGAPDAGTRYVPQPVLLPGASLLEEMALFGEAGFGVEQVRKLATSDAGDRPGLRGLGRVETDAPADILLFRRDPTEAIGNISSLEAVIAAGKLYRITDLNRPLQSNQADFTSPLIMPLARPGAQRALAPAPGRSRGLSSVIAC